MSIPSCIRPQRIPNGLVTGPFTGQMKPEAEGDVSAGPEYDDEDDCAERICAASDALEACSPATSCRNSDFDSFTFWSASRLRTRAAASRFLLASSRSRAART